MEMAVRKVLEMGFRTPDLARGNPHGYSVLSTVAMGKQVREMLHKILSHRDHMVPVAE